jgi:hypothetical protein
MLRLNHPLGEIQACDAWYALGLADREALLAEHTDTRNIAHEQARYHAQQENERNRMQMQMQMQADFARHNANAPPAMTMRNEWEEDEAAFSRELAARSALVRNRAVRRPNGSGAFGGDVEDGYDRRVRREAAAQREKKERKEGCVVM